MLKGLFVFKWNQKTNLNSYKYISNSELLKYLMLLLIKYILSYRIRTAEDEDSASVEKQAKQPEGNEDENTNRVKEIKLLNCEVFKGFHG